jgi:hypothetical protein
MIDRMGYLIEVLRRWSRRECERKTLGAPCRPGFLCDGCYAREALAKLKESV